MVAELVAGSPYVSGSGSQPNSELVPLSALSGLALAGVRCQRVPSVKPKSCWDSSSRLSRASVPPVGHPTATLGAAAAALAGGELSSVAATASVTESQSAV